MKNTLHALISLKVHCFFFFLRPAAFITTLAKEVARYNAMQQNAQTLNVNVNNSVLHKAKPEILRGVELLIEKMQNEMADLLVEVRVFFTKLTFYKAFL